MNGHGTDWAVTLAVAAVLLGILGLVGGYPPVTIAGYVLLFGAIGVIASDSITPSSVLAAAAFAIAVAGIGVTIIGYALANEAMQFGGIAIVVAATCVAIGELWGMK